jgi:hypothetical protein
MKMLRADNDFRTLVAIIMFVVWLSPALEARQVSPPSGATRNCEAERGLRDQKAGQIYRDALASIDRKKSAAIASCSDAFNNVDIPDCTRKYNDAMKTLLAITGTATLSCAGVCLVVVTPVGATVAPSCVTCIAATYVTVAGGVAAAVVGFTSCVNKAKDTASKCGRDAARNAEVANADAADAYDRAIMESMNLFKQCKASVGG